MVFITDSLLQCMPGVSVYSLPLPQCVQYRRIRNVSFVLFFLRETSGIKGRRATLNLSRKKRCSNQESRWLPRLWDPNGWNLASEKVGIRYKIPLQILVHKTLIISLIIK